MLRRGRRQSTLHGPPFLITGIGTAARDEVRKRMRRALRELNDAALEARVLGMDHGFRGVGFDSLMHITAEWTEESFSGGSDSSGSERE
jgi:hypothetical protein